MAAICLTPRIVHDALQLFTYSLPVDISFAVAASGHIYSRREVHVSLIRLDSDH